MGSSGELGVGIMRTTMAPLKIVTIATGLLVGGTSLAMAQYGGYGYGYAAAPLYDYAAPGYGYGAAGYGYGAGTTVIIVTPGYGAAGYGYGAPYTAPPVASGYYNYAPGYGGGYGRWGVGYGWR
jgi:hypothetical protein